MTALLAGCSGGGDSTESDASGDAGAEVSRAPSLAQDGTADELRTQPTTKGGDSSTPDPAAERAVINTGTVSLHSADVGEARRAVQRVVDAQRGEVTEEETETDEDGVVAYARMVLRVPSARFDDTMTALEESAELRTSGRTGEDVTTQVIDTRARVRAQEQSLERVEALLARADSLKQIVWIESQLTRRQSDLDSLKSQQAWLADQSSLSTITVDVEKSPEAKTEDERDAGFLAGLDSGLAALGSAAVALATVVGALLPFAVVLALLGLPGWLLVRRVSAARSARNRSAAPAGQGPSTG